MSTQVSAQIVRFLNTSTNVSELTSQSGAGLVGITPTAPITATTVQTALDQLAGFTSQSQLQQVTVTAGQTVVTVPFTYVTGTNTLFVFVNGVLQSQGYTETNSTTVTFDSPLPGGDVAFLGLRASNVGTATASNVTVSNPPDSSSISVQTYVNNLYGNNGAVLVGFLQSGTGAMFQTLQKKLGQIVCVNDFRQTGDPDDTLSFQRAHDYVNGLAFGGTVFGSSGASYVLGSGISWNTNKVGFDGLGCFIDNSGQLSGTFLTITQGEADVNKRPPLNRSHPWERVVIKGCDTAAGTTVGILLQDANASPTVAGVAFRNGGIIGYRTQVSFGNGAFFTTFDNWDFDAISGTAPGTCLYMPTVVNGGERNVFINCRFGSATTAFLNQNNGNASTYFIGCSFNYAAGRMITTSAGAIFFSGHIEGNSDTDYWIYVSGTNTLFHAESLNLVQASAKSAFPFFYSDSTATQGGVSIKNVNYVSVSTYTLPLVGGTGRTVIDNITQLYTGTHPYIGAGANRLAYGGFESVNFSSEVTLAGTTPPTQSTANPHTGSNALRFSGISGQNNSASWTIPCKPGQYFSGTCWAAASGFGTGGHFYGQIYYADKGGNVLVSGVVFDIQANASYAEYRFSNATMAPPGTVSAIFSVSFFGVTTGTPFGDLDDVILNVT